jgi:hypothetical protein
MTWVDWYNHAMSKTLITHINPHLDDIAALWLFKKFHPDFTDAEIKFVSAAKGNLPADESEDEVYLGVGRGKYDEHKGDLEDAAVSLVWKDLKSQNFGPKNEEEEKALDELVDFVRLDDLGKLKDLKYSEFSFPGFIRIGGGQEDSIKNTELGFEILNRIFKILTNKQKANKEWENAITLDTKWGKGYAVSGTYVNRSFCDTKDGEVYLMVDPKHKAVQFYTPNDNIDLESIYQKVKEADPNASWFLHQSHKMVICGSGSAPDSTPTKLNFNQLIEILKSNP